MVTKEQILRVLPPYRDEWVTIVKDQSVGDIIEEVVKAHKRFAGYYDKIAPFFAGKSERNLADDLYKCCKENIKYREETDQDQTTALPAGLLTRGQGDCKHYAGFIGGVLDALNRCGDQNLDWCYRFASYDPFRLSPHHVFVVVKDKDGNEDWIDPTPGSIVKLPVYFKDKKIKNTMALHSNIGAVTPGTEMIPVDPQTLVMSFYQGQWHASDKYGEIDLGENKVGDAVDIATGIVKSLITIFQSKDPGAMVKVFQMFPLSASPTASEVASQINAAIKHEATQQATDNSEWKAAFQALYDKYTQLYNALAGTNYASPVLYVTQSFPAGTSASNLNTAPAINPATGLPVTTTASGGIMNFITSNPLMSLGIGLGLFFVGKKLLSHK